MPRADEPRVLVRMGDQDLEKVKAAAERANVGVAGLMRECSVRFADEVADRVLRGEITLRRARIETAVAASEGQVRPAVELVSVEPVVSDRQLLLNQQAARARAARVQRGPR